MIFALIPITHNYQLYTPETIKKKDVTANCLCTRKFRFSHSLM